MSNVINYDRSKLAREESKRVAPIDAQTRLLDIISKLKVRVLERERTIAEQSRRIWMLEERLERLNNRCAEYVHHILTRPGDK